MTKPILSVKTRTSVYRKRTNSQPYGSRCDFENKTSKHCTARPRESFDRSGPRDVCFGRRLILVILLRPCERFQTVAGRLSRRRAEHESRDGQYNYRYTHTHTTIGEPSSVKRFLLIGSITTYRPNDCARSIRFPSTEIISLDTVFKRSTITFYPEKKT